METPAPPDYIRISQGVMMRNAALLATVPDADAAAMYRATGCSYPKFFKMDVLCKWAWLGAEILLRKDDGSWRYEGLDKRSIALVLATADGCIDVDRRYVETMQTIASPALFVYTLPNIMLGEICIRHGFTGEQLCFVQEGFDAKAILFTVQDLLQNRGVTQCLFGWADAAGAHHDVCLFWADAATAGSLRATQLQAVYTAAMPSPR